MSQQPERNPDPAYHAPPPSRPLPIVIVGSGGIVRDAHLPAYRKAGFPVVGLIDRVRDRAVDLAEQFGVAQVYDSLPDAVAENGAGAVYDLATMPDQFVTALEALSDNAAVLVQKPLGYTFRDASRIAEVVSRKGLRAAVNTQLRFAPYVREARRIIASGEIGDLIDIAIDVRVETPWEQFPSVFGLERMEMPMHSIHYVDLVRSFVGDPASVSAVTVPHPDKPLASTRTAYIMHYPTRPLRVVISTNHDQSFGPGHQSSSIVLQGTYGCLRIQMGLLLNYPRGGPDQLQLSTGDGWRDLPFEGSWFPDAFAGTMGALQRFATGEAETLPTSVRDGLRTMAALEAAHLSNAKGGVRLPD